MYDTQGHPTSDPAEPPVVILAAVDASPIAGQVVEVAARAARRMWANSTLHMVHVWRTARFDRPASAGFTREELTREAREYLKYQVNAALKQATVPVEGHFAEGDPAEQVLRLSRTLRADLLVIGTHDTAGLERFLVGSVAQKVMRKAHCSVLVVRRKQRPYVKLDENTGALLSDEADEPSR